MAYDLFVSSQREAMIVARGRHPADDPEAYRSVPSGVFSFFNPEAMMWGGWDMKNVEAMEFFDRIKIDIAEESLKERGLGKNALNEVDKIEYGARLFKELSPIPDFFSSGWRRNVMMQQMEDLMVFKYLSKTTIDNWRRRYPGISKAQIKDLLNELPIVMGDRTISAKDDRELQADLADLRRKFRGRETDTDPQVRQAVADGKAKAKEFALFAQLHKEADHGDLRKNKKTVRQDTKGILDKIAVTKPEEIIRLLKDRLPIRKAGGGHGHAGGHGDERPDYKEQVLGDGHSGWHDELDPLQRDLAGIMGLGSEYIPSLTATASEKSAYDEFRDKYGHIVTLLRENAMREDTPRVVNLRNLTVAEQALVNRAGIVDQNGNPVANAADVLMRGYGAMQDFIATKRVHDPLAKQDVGITQLMVQDYRFEDAYNKIWSVDDMFLDELEEPPKVTGLLRASEVVSTEPGGDGYRRTMNDTMDGIRARDGLYVFLTKETPEDKMKGAQEYAGGIGSANGQEAIAKAMRFTYGSYLDMSKPYYWLDLVGLKGIGRIPVSQIQKIYGPEAHVFEREELRQIIDRDLRFMLAGSAGKKELQDRILYERGLIDAHELEHRKHSYVKENEALLNSLKKRVGVTRADEWKTRAIQTTLFILLAMLASAALAAVTVATEESTGSSGGGGGGGPH
jgi:hypothetical protein